ncbi:MAG: ribosomal protein L7/L12 [Vicinamibacterales bacterium]
MKKTKRKSAAVGDRYDVMLTGCGEWKIPIAKIVEEITGRKRVCPELIDFLDRPNPIKTAVSNDEAEYIKRRIEEASGSVKIVRARAVR